MADNVAVTAGTGTTIAADEVVDGTLGTVKVQYVKLMAGTLDSTTKITPTTPSDTQPVSASSLPLPTGAATSAKQAALGTAGSASADVLSIQGVASMTPIKTDPSGVTAPMNLTQINGSAISSTNPLPTTQVAPTGNGFTPYKLINAATTNATNVKASAGDVGGIQVYNNSGVVAYFKLYDKASAPTVGTDTPVKTIIVPANTSGAGTNVSFASPGISFTSGISFALTTGITDADTGAIASANTISINIDYK